MAVRRTSRPTLVLAAILCLVAGLLAASPAQAATGSITGRILAKPTGGTVAVFGANQAYAALYRADEPGVGGWTSAGSYDTTATGRFSATGLADGYYTIRAFDVRDVAETQKLASEYYDNGWSPYGATQVRVLNGQAVTLKDIVLERPGGFAGTVRDEAGQPIPHASVSVSPSDGAGGYGFSTDAQGHYDSRTTDLTSDLFPRTYSVNVSADSGIGQPVYEGKTVPVAITADQVTALDVVLKRRSTKTFIVKNPDGTPAANAPVGLQVRRDGVWGPAQFGPICTDSQGRYRFTQSGDTAYKAFFQPAGDTACGQGTAQTPSPAGTVGEYWKDAYALEDAAVIDFSGAQSDLTYTVTLGAEPAVKHGTVGISGTPEVGNTLTAEPGTWGPSGVELSYQWTADGAPIEGATGKTLALTSALEGTYLGVRVTGRLTGAPSVDQVAYASQAVAPRIIAVKPTIAGTTTSGSTLTAKVGTWKPSGLSFSYRWLADGAPISGATSKTFALTNSQAGKKISVKVTGSRTGSTSVPITSASTAAVKGVLGAKKPTISGTAQKGKKLTANVTAWTPAPVTLKYQWLRNGVAISGATAKTYTLTSASVGKKITVRVTGTKTSYVSRSSTSLATATVKS